MPEPHPFAAFRARFDPAVVPDGAYEDDGDVVLFVHIPKTAGMSVGRALRDAFDVFHPINWANIPASFRDRTKEALYLRTDGQPRRQVIMGHFGWPEMQFWRNQELPIKAASIIRDPVARIVSNYNYNLSEAHPAHQAFGERFPTLEAYVDSVPNDMQLNMLIGAFWSFDHALELLAKYYSFLGATERLGPSLNHFARSHGLGARLDEHRENVGAKPAEEEDIPSSVRDRVLERSRNDLRLHEMVLRLYSDAAR